MHADRKFGSLHRGHVNGRTREPSPAVHRLESTARYLGIEVEDALEIAEQTEV